MARARMARARAARRGEREAVGARARCATPHFAGEVRLGARQLHWRKPASERLVGGLARVLAREAAARAAAPRDAKAPAFEDDRPRRAPCHRLRRVLPLVRAREIAPAR